ncbi:MULTISPECIES: type II secretion system protein [unclassified Helicobacter]|uniref:type II secretion system protein n=1 Tax=unclassified Helicobacter TaxID=2593540 RepID=UPI001F1D40F6|nr:MULTISPECIES: prepilin-type N-terminal cleavage/methylation domain-containing protein [unclassified Helicobacter]
MRWMQKAFSMIELVFVIVILGIIASIALPKLSLSRSDAQYSAIVADIQTIISTIEQKYLVEDLNLSQLNGEIIMQSARLSPSRWISSNTGVRLAKNQAIDQTNNCVSIDFNQRNLVVKIDSLIQTPLCQKLAKQYPKPLIIPLENNTIKF